MATGLVTRVALGCASELELRSIGFVRDGLLSSEEDGRFQEALSKLELFVRDFPEEA
jgi:hypothetical protein